VTSKVAQLTVTSPETPTFRQLPRRSSSLDSRKSSSSASGVKKQTIVPELAALMIYTAGVKYRGFSKLVEYKVEEMFSVSEKVATKILKATPLDFIKHNRGHLSRVYPHGIRLTSTNYAPHHFWAMGAQLVALNWQTCGAYVPMLYRKYSLLKTFMNRFRFRPECRHVRSEWPFGVHHETRSSPDPEQGASCE
jgi:hypothetical protein